MTAGMHLTRPGCRQGAAVLCDGQMRWHVCPHFFRGAYHNQPLVLLAIAYVTQNHVKAAVATASNLVATQHLANVTLLLAACHYHVTAWRNGLMAGMGRAYLCEHSVLCSSEFEAQHIPASLHHAQLGDPGALHIRLTAGGPVNLPPQQQLQLEQQQLLKGQTPFCSLHISPVSGLMNGSQGL